MALTHTGQYSGLESQLCSWASDLFLFKIEPNSTQPRGWHEPLRTGPVYNKCLLSVDIDPKLFSCGDGGGGQGEDWWAFSEQLEKPGVDPKR